MKKRYVLIIVVFLLFIVLLLKLLISNRVSETANKIQNALLERNIVLLDQTLSPDTLVISGDKKAQYSEIRSNVLVAFTEGDYEISEGYVYINGEVYAYRKIPSDGSTEEISFSIWPKVQGISYEETISITYNNIWNGISIVSFEATGFPDEGLFDYIFFGVRRVNETDE